MYNPDIHSVRSGNYYTLTLTTPVVKDSKEPGDYNKLQNKPRINGVELVGDVSLTDLGLGDAGILPLTNNELDEIVGE